MSRPTRIEVDLDALEHNFQVARRHAPDSQTVACIKADAYGHGAAQVAARLDGKADLFGVAALEEALALDHLPLRTGFLLMEGCFSRHEQEEALNRSYHIVLHNWQQLEWIADANPVPGVKLWIKLETGMHRLGFPAAKLPEVLNRIGAAWQNQLVLMTHFACAEEPNRQPTLDQLGVFERAATGRGLPTSLANSAAVLDWPQAHGRFIRPGFMLYGNSPMPGEAPAVRDLQPVMRFCSQVMAIHHLATGEGVGYNLRWRAQRDSVIAVVAAGYGDGYPRTARDGTPVLVNNHRAPLAGTVSMDMLTLDVTGLGKVDIGDEVELWGPQLAATEVAEFNQMSAYELFTRLPLRPKRVYPGQ